MNRIIFIAAGIFFMLLLSTVITFTYIAVYKRTISRRISSGITSEDGRKNMMAPFHLFLIVSSIGIAAFMIFLAVGSVGFKNEDTVKMRLYDCSSDGLVREFDNESEISGYTRTEKTDGDIHLVCYLRNDPDDKMFPEVLIYAESSVDNTYKIKQSFETSELNKTSDEMISDLNISSGRWFACQADNFKGRVILEFTCQSDSKKFTFDIR